MPKVKIYLKCLSEEEKWALLLLLKEAGCEVVAIDENDAEEPGIVPGQVEHPTDDVLIVLINPACGKDSDLENAARRAVGRGCRVIGVWPKGESDGKVPSALEKYGADVVTWNPIKLRKAAEEAPAQWETPAGSPRAEPATKRNRCG